MTADMRVLLGNAVESAGMRRHPAGDPKDTEESLLLLSALYSVGRTDVPLGRLLEGHVDAVQIIRRLGTPEQQALLLESLRAGKTFGVWNASLPGEPLTISNDVLSGGKSYASGADVIDIVVTTVDDHPNGDGGAQLLIVDTARMPPDIETGWWNVTGMQRSQTHRVRWNGVRLASHALLGKPGDYEREPYLSGGALRFLAVQSGAIAGIVDRTRRHLENIERLDDPFQQARLCELFNVAESAAGSVKRTAHAQFDESGATHIARVAATRIAVLNAAQRAIALARDSVGLPAMFVDHPLSELLTDLDTYLRQPVPDLMRMRAGKAVGDRLLVPDFQC